MARPSPVRDPAPRSPAAADLSAALAATPSLEHRILEIRARVPGRIAFSTSLGLEDQVILHAIWATGAAVDIFTLDTGRLFPETLETLAASEARYDLPIRVVLPETADVAALLARDGALGFRQSVAARKACCAVRKVAPLGRALAGAAGWVTGLRRGQSDTRSALPFAEVDPERGLLKVNPIADWSLAELEAYVAANAVPVNPLHARGYPSIGCDTCTRAVRPGEDARAGRWWWEHDLDRLEGKECGLHTRRLGPAEAGR